MIKLNITNDGVVETPISNKLPIIEVTEEQYSAIRDGRLVVVNGKLVENKEME